MLGIPLLEINKIVFVCFRLLDLKDYWLLDFLVSKIVGFLVPWFLGFLVLASWFLGFLVSCFIGFDFLGLVVSNFLGFKVKDLPHSHFTFSGKCWPGSRIFVIVLDGSSGLFGARLFGNCQHFGFSTS